MDAAGQSPPPRPLRQRGTVACRRCRRQRAKCVHEGARPPCRRCAVAGCSAAASCSFPARGERDTDRVYRNPRHLPGNMPPGSHANGPDAAAGGDTPGQATLTASSLPSLQSDSPLSARPSLALQLCSLPTPSQTHHQHHRPRQSLSAASSPPLPHRRLPLLEAPAPPASSTLQPADSIDPSLAGSAASHGPSVAVAATDTEWPPHGEVVEGCRTFVTCYFQLGFLPKAVFLEKLAAQDTASPSSSGYTSRFLLCCILSISSRFTPSLVRRYGSKAAATDHFLQLAQRMAPSEMYSPSLERVQAFFLLSIAEWGNSDRDRSAMDMGVAVRQAVVLKLHREETYCLPPTATADAVVQAESARRTFWMIHSQENLHSGTTSPAPVPVEDITALLPCNETDFSFGDVPATRAALAGTIAAREHPELVFHPQRCLFATLIQAHSLWGHVARHATPGGCLESAHPWEKGSIFTSITTQLRVWEAKLPARHCWSLWNLRGWRAEGLHLAYLSVVMVLRLSNIVVRRIYLDSLVQALSGAAPEAAANGPSTTTPASLATPPAADRDSTSPRTRSSNSHSAAAAPAGFWQQVSHELFDNVVELHEQVVAYFHIRTQDEGFPAILVFCVYVCGSLASDLWHNPCLCPHITPAEAEDMAMSTLRILSELYQAWPVSARWQLVLRHISGTESLGGPQHEREKNDQGTDSSGSGAGAATGTDGGSGPHTEAAVSSPQTSAANPPGPGGDTDDAHPAAHSVMLMADFPNELFSAELAEYLEGSVHYGLLDGFYFKP